MSSRSVLIYGASGGIGSAIARRLSAQGDTVHLVGRDAEKLKALASELDASWSSADLNDDDAFASVMRDCDRPLDGLVYAVGTINLKSLKRLKLSDFMNDFRLNAAGAACAVQAALPALQQTTGASIVLFSSVAASQGFPMHASMGMAKAAVSGLTVSLAAELAPQIRVNAIAPSLTKTPLAAPILANQAMADALAGQHPMQRLGTPDDIAPLAIWLLGPESSWVTGQVIGVDGGRSTIQGKK